MPGWANPPLRVRVFPRGKDVEKKESPPSRVPEGRGFVNFVDFGSIDRIVGVSPYLGERRRPYRLKRAGVGGDPDLI